jgi:prepilin-type processing-associated H-X9-DG protein
VHKKYVQGFDQHKNGKINFLFNDGSAAAKTNIIVNETSEYLKKNESTIALFWDLLSPRKVHFNRNTLGLS